MAEAKQQLSAENKSLLEAITLQFQLQGNQITAVKGTLDQLLSMVNALSQKGKSRSSAASGAAGTSAAATKAPAFPKTVKPWFIRKYTENESERSKYLEFMDGIHAHTGYVSAKPAEKLKKEATLLYDTLVVREDKKGIIEALNREFEAERTKLKQEHGHIAATTAAAATTAPAATATTATSLTAAATAITGKAVKPRAPRAPAKGRSKKVANAAPATAATGAPSAVITPEDAAEDSADDEGQAQ